MDLQKYLKRGISNIRSVSQYLTSRENLKKIFVLIDNSLGPKKIDIEMIDSMKQIKQKIIICYTKSDKKIKEKSAF